MPGGFKITPLAGMTQPRGSDWISRVTIPDLYPRKYDDYAPGVAVNPATGLPDMSPPAGPSDFLNGWLTEPAERPRVYQRGVNFQGTATATPAPIVNQKFDCDSFVLDVASTVVGSMFFGFGNSITTGSGIEVQPGLPILVEPENTRELWELQSRLEIIAAMMAYQLGIQPPGPYMAPRVVFDPSSIFVVSAGSIPFSVMLFYPPEKQ